MTWTQTTSALEATGPRPGPAVARYVSCLGLAASVLAGCASHAQVRPDPHPPAPTATATVAVPGPSPTQGSSSGVAPAREAVPLGQAALAPPEGEGAVHHSSTAGLSRELEALLATPTLSTAVVSALVESLDSGEVLFEHQPDTLVVPGSNMKIITMAAAARRLGWEYRYETRLETIAETNNGRLDGDIVVVGSGDPTINGRNGDRLEVFRSWAAALKQAGVARIGGRLVGDDDAFDDQRFGDGWSWDDFVYAYAAPIGALQFNESAVDVSIRAGSQIGAPATVALSPSGAEITVTEHGVLTGPAETETIIKIGRFPGQPDLRLWGSLPLGGPEVILRASIDNPTAYFVRVLRDVLRSEGIMVEGAAVDIDDVPDRAALKASTAQRRVLVRHLSPALSEIGRTLMKVSQNLYAETVFRTLSSGSGPATIPASRDVEIEMLRAWGVAPGEYSIADGSGLSRLNFVSSSAIVRVLRGMAVDPALSSAFEATLPIAGRDGTLAGRMKATRAEGNAVGKTGTLSSVRSLAGYVRTKDGERLVFAFLVNNFLIPSGAVDAVVDRAVERLAEFSR